MRSKILHYTIDSIYQEVKLEEEYYLVKIGRNFFLTYEECVEFAERETADYERRWKTECMKPWRG